MKRHGMNRKPHSMGFHVTPRNSDPLASASLALFIPRSRLTCLPRYSERGFASDFSDGIRSAETTYQKPGDDITVELIGPSGYKKEPVLRLPHSAKSSSDSIAIGPLEIAHRFEVGHWWKTLVERWRFSPRNILFLLKKRELASPGGIEPPFSA